MTVFVDAGGLSSLGVPCYGGLEEYTASVEGKPPPVKLYKPRPSNIAPRTDGWSAGRGNTQTPPLSGPNKHQKPAAQQPRAPLFTEVRKVTTY